MAKNKTDNTKEKDKKPLWKKVFLGFVFIDVPVSRIQDLLHDRRKITAETSVKLGKLFGLSENYFLNLQNDIDIREAKLALGNSLSKIVPLTVR